MKHLRGVLGIVLGLLVGTAGGMAVETWLFAEDPAGFVWRRLVGVTLLVSAQLLAGFLAATIAGRRRLWHAGIVAGLFALVRLAWLVRESEFGSSGFPIGSVGLGIAAIFLGGRLAVSFRLSK